jgi:threonine dehydratase
LFERDELFAARDLVRRHLPPTALIDWPLLSAQLGATVLVKHENHNPTGAFKVRGGLTYLARLVREQAKTPRLITATRGNHGQSLAYAAAIYDVPLSIVVPFGNSREKNDAMRAMGATLIEHGADFEDARQEMLRRAAADGFLVVPSFHRDLVIGVATYALELFERAPDLDLLYVPIGLGSGIAGCIRVRDLLGLKTEIVGVQAEGAPAYALSFEAGRPISANNAATLADGVATRVPDPDAVRIINQGAARVVLVSDQEIASAIRRYWSATHNLAEGAGAAALAAAVKERMHLGGKKIGLVLSGGNIDAALFQKWIAAG